MRLAPQQLALLQLAVEFAQQPYVDLALQLVLGAYDATTRNMHAHMTRVIDGFAIYCQPEGGSFNPSTDLGNNIQGSGIHPCHAPTTYKVAN